MRKRAVYSDLYSNQSVTLLAVLVATLLVAACGGGGGGGGDTATVIPANEAPIAQTGSLITDEDAATNSTLTGTDADGDPLTYSIASQGTLGTASITNPTTGAFTYMPNANENGIDNFTFKANDGTADSNVAAVTVTILAAGDAPVAEPGSLTTDEDTPAGSTLNASDADGDLLTYSLVSQGTRGTVNITDPVSGAFTYTPKPDENGTDVFSFKANDGLDDSNIATVSVDINPVNDLPTASGSCSTTPQAQTLAGVLGGTDLETPALLMYSLNADGSGLRGPILTAKGGTVTITSQTTGAFTYQPNMSAGDKRGLDSFEYQVSDTDGGVDSATETVIIDQKIMPLGDSITQGSITPTIPEDQRVGYRKPLYDTLIASGFTFDFVGSVVNHGSALLVDFEHEGHGGWTVFDIAWGQNPPADGVFAWLDANPADIILLHAGTNDLSNTTEDDVKDILDEIDRWENSADGNPVTVILARIIDRDSLNNPLVAAFNDAVEAMANSRTTDDIIIVDQQQVVNYNTDMSDTLHPDDGGYANMAAVWFDALAGAVDKCP